MIKAVIFDMDGVLFNSEEQYMKLSYEIIKQKYPFVSWEDLLPAIGISTQDYFPFMAKVLRKEYNEELIEETKWLMSEVKVDYKSCVRENIHDTLSKLKAFGLKLAVASSSSDAIIADALTGSDILKYFDSVVSGENFHNSKPEPDIYLYTFEKLGIKPEEAIIVEDSKYGIMAGKRAGGTVYAYKEDVFGIDQSLADGYINCLEELVGILARQFKIAFFDADGTLSDMASHKMAQSTVDSLLKLQSQGVKIVLATGRSPIELVENHMFEEINFDGYIYMNGQLCLLNNEVVGDHPFSKQQLEIIADFLDKNKISAVFFDRENYYCNFADELIAKVQAAIGSNLPASLEKETLKSKTIYQIVPTMSQAKQDELFENLSDCTVSRWGEYVIDILTIQGGKANGVKDFLKKLNLSVNQAMAFGDGDNDIEMLKTCGFSIAMGNSNKQVKAASSFVTKDLKEDGVSFALNYFQILV